MSIKDLTKECLEKVPASRERKNRSKLVWWVLQRETNGFDSMNKELFCELFTKGESISRWARKLQEENPELRGTDYEEKERLEQEKQEELGYQ